MSQREQILELVDELRTHPATLIFAKNVGNAFVDGPKNHCAATLSALLNFAGIYPVGLGKGHTNIEPWCPTLMWDLESKRGWSRVGRDAFGNGDVGVVVEGATHHCYLVIDATDQASPLIADNQLEGLHHRAVAGDPAQSFSPTDHFLRAPG